MKNVLMEEIRGPSFSCGHIFIFSFSENARMLPFLSAGTLLAKIFIRMDRMAFVEYIVQKKRLAQAVFYVLYYCCPAGSSGGSERVTSEPGRESGSKLPASLTGADTSCLSSF